MMPAFSVKPWLILVVALAVVMLGRDFARAQDIGPLIETTDQGKTWHPEGSGRTTQSSGSSGYAPSPGLTPEQVAAQRRQVEEYQRKQAAFNQNETGVGAYKRGDWNAAVQNFQNALQYTPDDPIIQGNLQNALAAQAKQLEDARAEEQRKTQDAEAAKKMGDGINQLAARLSQMQSPAGLSEPGSAQLQFMGTGPELKSVASSAEKIKTILKNNPGDGAAEALSGTAGEGFDTPGKYGGTIDPVNLQGLDRPHEAFTMPEELKSDSAVKGFLQQRTDALKEKAALQAELTKAEKERQAKTAAQESIGQLDVRMAELQDQETRVDSRVAAAEANIKEVVRMRSFHVDPLKEQQTKPAESQPANSVPSPSADQGGLQFMK